MRSGFSTSSIKTLSVYSCWRWSLLGILPDKNIIPFRHALRYAYFLKAFTLLQSQSLVNGREFLNQKQCMLPFLDVFHFRIFGCCLSVSRSIIASGLSSNPSKSFYKSFIHSTFSLYVLSFFIHDSKFILLFFFCPRLLMCLHTLSTNILVEFSFVVLECPSPGISLLFLLHQ